MAWSLERNEKEYKKDHQGIATPIPYEETPSRKPKTKQKSSKRYSYRTRARKHFFQTQRHPKEIIYSGSNKNKYSQNFRTMTPIS